MKKYVMALTVMLTYPLTLLAGGLVSESSSNAKVYFIHPSDGQGIKGKVSVVFGLKNMGVAPAGTNRKTQGITIY